MTMAVIFCQPGNADFFFFFLQMIRKSSVPAVSAIYPVVQRACIIFWFFLSPNLEVVALANIFPHLSEDMFTKLSFMSSSQAH